MLIAKSIVITITTTNCPRSCDVQCCSVFFPRSHHVFVCSEEFAKENEKSIVLELSDVGYSGGVIFLGGGG